MIVKISKMYLFTFIHDIVFLNSKPRVQEACILSMLFLSFPFFITYFPRASTNGLGQLLDTGNGTKKSVNGENSLLPAQLTRA